jgi:Tol biopolymer transport system component
MNPGAYTNNFEIYVMNADDGSDVTRLTDNDAFDCCPSWSPDGTKIAFESGGQIYVMNPDGSGQINISNNPAGDFDPSWSPDGTKIAFVSNRDVLNKVRDEIYVMNADGSNQTRLTNSKAFDGRPDWGPATEPPPPPPPPSCRGELPP